MYLISTMVNSICGEECWVDDLAIDWFQLQVRWYITLLCRYYRLIISTPAVPDVVHSHPQLHIPDIGSKYANRSWDDVKRASSPNSCYKTCSKITPPQWLYLLYWLCIFSARTMHRDPWSVVESVCNSFISSFC